MSYCFALLDTALADDLADDATGLDAGQFLVETLEWEAQFFVVDAEQMENGRVEIVDIEGLGEQRQIFRD